MKKINMVYCINGTGDKLPCSLANCTSAVTRKEYNKFKKACRWTIVLSDAEMQTLVSLKKEAKGMSICAGKVKKKGMDDVYNNITDYVLDCWTRIHSIYRNAHIRTHS
jgi:hypothetical protein